MKQNLTEQDVDQYRPTFKVSYLDACETLKKYLESLA